VIDENRLGPLIHSILRDITDDGILKADLEFAPPIIFHSKSASISRSWDDLNAK
jgi:hypothetical protein